MVDAALVDKIVARVLALLDGEPVDPSPRQVLMIFSGASTGFVVGTEAIRRLANSHHQLSVVLTPAATHVITEAHVRQAGASRVILPGEWVDAPGLVKASDLVLAPTMSMNLAARLALGLMDSLVTTLIIGALLAGKPVIAVRAGADPDGNAGLVFGATGRAAPALRAKLSGHLETLAAYGVELVNEGDFLVTVERRLLTGVMAHPGQPASALPPDFRLAGPPALVETPPTSNSANFVTETDLLTLPTGAVVRLAPGSRLTPLARETAERRNLKIVFE